MGFHIFGKLQASQSRSDERNRPDNASAHERRNPFGDRARFDITQRAGDDGPRFSCKTSFILCKARDGADIDTKALIVLLGNAGGAFMKHGLVDVLWNKLHLPDKNLCPLAVDRNPVFRGMQKVVMKSRVRGKVFSGIEIARQLRRDEYRFCGAR